MRDILSRRLAFIHSQRADVGVSRISSCRISISAETEMAREQRRRCGFIIVLQCCHICGPHSLFAARRNEGWPQRRWSMSANASRRTPDPRGRTQAHSEANNPERSALDGMHPLKPHKEITLCATKWMGRSAAGSRVVHASRVRSQRAAVYPIPCVFVGDVGRIWILTQSGWHMSKHSCDRASSGRYDSESEAFEGRVDVNFRNHDRAFKEFCTRSKTSRGLKRTQTATSGACPRSASGRVRSRKRSRRPTVTRVLFHLCLAHLSSSPKRESNRFVHAHIGNMLRWVYGYTYNLIHYTNIARELRLRGCKPDEDATSAAQCVFEFIQEAAGLARGEIEMEEVWEYGRATTLLALSTCYAPGPPDYHNCRPARLPCPEQIDVVRRFTQSEGPPRWYLDASHSLPSAMRQISRPSAILQRKRRELFQSIFESGHLPVKFVVAIPFEVNEDDMDATLVLHQQLMDRRELTTPLFCSTLITRPGRAAKAIQEQASINEGMAAVSMSQ
jgi:hypothetical protein